MKEIKYSIHAPVTEAFATKIQSSLLDHSLKGSDGDIDTAWAALITTDGTGGYVDSNLVHAAALIEDHVPTDRYSISDNYDSAFAQSLSFNGSSVDPVNGIITF